MDLSALAQRITAATNIPVHVRPDALLGLDRFLPKLGNEGASSPALAAPTTVALTGGPEPLARILDRIGARLGVAWRYEKARIEFYRTETRVFNVRSLTLQASAQASVGLGGRNDREGFGSRAGT